MKSEEFWRLRQISDAGLRSGLSALLVSDGRTEARIVAHLAEVDRRKLYLKDGYSALFKYCQGALGLSENQSFHRMTAAKIARRFPVVFGMLERRELHLSGLCQLRDFLTQENHLELLEWAAGKSKRQLEAQLAARFPGERAPDSMRKLPSGQVKPVIAAPTVARSNQPLPARSEPSNRSLFESPTGLVQTFEPVTGELLTVAAEPRMGIESDRVPERELPTEVEAEARYRIQFDASSSLKAKIDLARALSSHANPRGDLETLFERALDAYVEQLQKRRFAQIEHPKKGKQRKDRGSPEVAESAGVGAVAVASAVVEPVVATSGKTATEVTTTEPVRLRRSSLSRRRWRGRRLERRKHVSHETRRLVVARDGLRCSFVAANGHRCEEQAFLQFDHRQLWSRWGSEEPDNLRMLCASHNRWLAEQVLGTSLVEQRIAEGRASSRPASRVDAD